MKTQFNFNSFLILVVGALLTFGIKKLDENNTELVKVSTSQTYMVKRMDNLEQKMAEMVLKSDFQSEVNRLNREMEAIKKRP